jgi:cholesterol transport system auxiliary component
MTLRNLACRPARAARLASALLLALLAAGCAEVPTISVGKQTALTYALAPKLPEPGERSTGKVLVVSTPQAEAAYASARMVYVEHPFERNFFARNEWAAPPPAMLGPLLVRALDASGGFSAVLAGNRGVAADLRLDTELLALHHEFLTQPSRVRLTLRAVLVDLNARRVIATRTFDEQEVSPTDDPYGGVVAINRALGRLLDDLTTFCITAAGG